MHYVETRMSFIAPNLTTIVGPVIAAKLMGIAGGLTALSKIPACNVKVGGSARQRTNVVLDVRSSDGDAAHGREGWAALGAGQGQEDDDGLFVHNDEGTQWRHIQLRHHPADATGPAAARPAPNLWKVRRRP